MVTQTPILVKFDYETLEALNAEKAVSWKSRNRIINEAVECYLDMIDTRRRCSSFTKQDAERERAEFIQRWFSHY